MKSWQHKLHLAKLAAWMRAKATEQVDDLAQSFVMEAKEEIQAIATNRGLLMVTVINVAFIMLFFVFAHKNIL